MVSMAVGQMGYSWSSVCSAAKWCARYFFAKGDIHHSPGQRPGLKNHLRPVWPTAIIIIALGNAQGHRVRSVACFAKGDIQASSVPDVLFIEFDAITVQQVEILFLESSRCMSPEFLNT
jgi:hypothetical protein